MKKLSEYQDEEALDLLADLIDPASEIFADPKIAAIIQNKGKMLDAAKIAIKFHKEPVMQLLAILDGVPRNEYHCNVFTIPKKLVDILNDEDLLNFFTYQGQKMASVSFGSVMASIEDDGK